MWQFLSEIPHCTVYGRPWLALALIVGDGLTAFAYVLIPTAIIIFLTRRHLPAHKYALSWLFAAFIMLCGLGHVMDSVAMIEGGEPSEWVSAIIDFLTGLVSIVTAYY